MAAGRPEHPAGPVAPSIQLPFSVGTTSFVLFDHALPNVEWLAGKVDDIQLLLLEPDGDLPSAADIERMKAVAALYGLSFTVHLPNLMAAGSNDAQRAAVDAAARLMALSAPLDPFGWVVHLDPGVPEPGPDRDRWIERGADSVVRLARAFGGDVAKVRVENQQARDLAPNRDVAAASGCRLCLDLGHVLAAGADPFAAVDAHLPEADHLHVHGVADRDHRALEHFPDLGRLVERLVACDFAGVFTIEVFGQDPFERSMAALRRAIRELDGGTG